MSSGDPTADMSVRFRTAANRVLSPSVRRRYRKLKRTGRQYQQRAFDRIAGTDTTGLTLDPTGRGKSSGHEYEATVPITFRRLIRKVPGDLGEFTFIDVGSGKGAVLLYASRLPFRAVVGVEHAEALHDVAVRNIEQYKDRRGRVMRCADVTSVHQDATTFEWPAGPIVVYLFSPLPREGTEQILANIERSLADSPRPAILVALNPFDDLYSAQPWLELIHRGWGNAVIYRSRPTGSGNRGAIDGI